MIRILICVALFFQTTSGFSKGNFLFPEISFKEISLQEINKDSTHRIIKGCKEYKRIFGLTDILDTVNHFYLSDIDNDKKKELIYYGLISAEGKWTIIWKVDNYDYQLLGELFGRITGISDSLYISTMGPGCCGSDCIYANLYRVFEDAIDFQRSVMIFDRAKTRNSVFLRSAEISDRVKIPDSLPYKKKFLVNNTRLSLRIQPIINDKPDSTDMERYGVLRGNVMIELGKGTVASATARFSDATGNEWWFLVLDNPPKATYNVFDKSLKNQWKICGWIGTKELDYTEIP